MKKIVAKCGGGKEWVKTEMYKAAQTNMSEELSIDLILQQLKYALSSVYLLLTQSQLKTLHLLERQSFLTAEEIRNYFINSNRYFYDENVKLVKSPKNPKRSDKMQILIKYSWKKIKRTNKIEN